MLEVASASDALELARSYDVRSTSRLGERHAHEHLVDTLVSWGQRTGCIDDIIRLPWTYQVR